LELIPEALSGKTSIEKASTKTKENSNLKRFSMRRQGQR
jgi:hypothetical protein